MTIITGVAAVQPQDPPPPPGWRSQLGQVGVRLTTDDADLVGFGVSGGGSAAITVITELLPEVLLGREIDDPGLWDAMYRATLPYGRKGLAVMAISGVDLAIWDCRAKAANASMVDFLGGARHARIPAYQTDPAWPLTAPPPGTTGVKIAVPQGKDDRWAVNRLTEARKLLGDEIDLMVDVGMAWDLSTATTFVERAEELNLGWLEEPLSPDDLAGYHELRQRTSIPIAGGEHEYTAHGFEQLLEAEAHDILQPDVTWCGGMTELVKIFAMAKRAGVRVYPHRGADAWALSATAALSTDPLGEEPRGWTAVLNGPVQLDSGGYLPANGLGFGVDLTGLDWKGTP